MQITFLGTSSGAPSLTRNMASLVLRLPQRASIWMFDCGEGTQHQALRVRMKLAHLERIFITHLHGDHIFGLPGLLASRSLQVSGRQPVVLYGPRGLEEFVQTALRLSQTMLSYPLEFVTVGEGIIFSGGGFTVACARTNHRIESFAYAVREDDAPGHFDAAKAQALGVPFGPLYGRLKAGETVTLPDGTVVDGKALVGPPRRGRSIVYTGDTIASDAVAVLAKGADVLIHESTYLSADTELADRAAHSTALSAARAAAESGVRTLILTHFSARYEGSNGSRMSELLEEARSVFPHTELAQDLWTYAVSRRGQEAEEAAADQTGNQK